MKRSSSWIAVLPTLVIPVCIGMMMYLGLSFLMNQGTISNELVIRYLTGHPVSEVTVAMFFVGMASLAMIAKNVFEQFGAERKITLDSPDQSAIEGASANPDSNAETESVIEDTNHVLDVTGLSNTDRAVIFGKSLVDMPAWMHEHYLWQRLVNSLKSVYRTNSTAAVEDELKYLADLDLDRQQQRYSLVRILIWATPMLGFLGTVLGISQALGGINVGPDNNFQQMMDGLRGSLYVAFDTTALALTLSMVLMFGQFLVDRFESQLLSLVDQRAKSEIGRQFDLSVSEPLSRQQMVEEMIQASRESVEKQTEIWRSSIRSAEQAWASSLTEVNAQVQTNLSDAIDENVSNLAHYMAEAINKADLAMTHRWGQWQVTLSDNARLMDSHQRQLCEQTELIHRLVSASENSPLFQPALDQNQRAIDATTELQKTLGELSAAIESLPERIQVPNVAQATDSVPNSSSRGAADTVANAEDESSNSDVVFGRRSEQASESPATIRFQPYQEAQQRGRSKVKSTRTESIDPDAEVILPFRAAIRRKQPIREMTERQLKKSA